MEVQPCESTAIEMGTYILSGKGGSMIDKGKFIVVWQKQNGDEKLYKDIWNSSVSNQPA